MRLVEKKAYKEVNSDTGDSLVIIPYNCFSNKEKDCRKKHTNMLSTTWSLGNVRANVCSKDSTCALCCFRLLVKLVTAFRFPKEQ